MNNYKRHVVYILFFLEEWPVKIALYLDKKFVRGLETLQNES